MDWPTCEESIEESCPEGAKVVGAMCCQKRCVVGLEPLELLQIPVSDI